MFLTSSCLIWCPTPKGKQGLFALKRTDSPQSADSNSQSTEIKTDRNFTGRTSLGRELSHSHSNGD